MSRVDGVEGGGDGLGDPCAALLQTHDHDAVEAVIALDDLVGDAGEGPAHVVGAEHGSTVVLLGRRPVRIGVRHVVPPRMGLTGPISRSSGMVDHAVTG